MSVVKHQGTFFGHPKGLFLLFTTELWERFSYYAMRAVLVLYLVDRVHNQGGGGLGWTQSEALSLYGTFTGLVFLTPLIGGWLADNYLGQRKSIYFGGAMMAMGQFLLAAPHAWFPGFVTEVFYLGLGILILIIGYIWLKLSLIRPFHCLMAQLADIDPNAQSYKPIAGSGCSELVVMADQVNTLLERIFQQKERTKVTLESIAEAVILTDTLAKVVYLNPPAERMLNTKGCGAVGTSIDSVLKADTSIKSALFSVMGSQGLQTVLNKHMFKTENARVMERSISHLLNHKQEVIGSVTVSYTHLTLPTICSV